MISRFFIDRPIFASVLSIVITLAGGISLFFLPVALYPPISPPTVQVDCAYPGASAQVVSETVATPIEQQVNGVENMLYMSSQCTNDGNYNLTVTFRHGVNLNMAQVLVQNKVALALPLLPDVIKQAGVNVRKMSPDILMAIAINSPTLSYDQLYLSNYALLNLRDELLRLPGVSDIRMLGQRDYSMRVWVDPERLAARDLAASDVVRAIRAQNAMVATGQIGQPPTPRGQPIQIPIDTMGRLTEVEDFENIIIKSTMDGRVVRLRDVARIELGAKNQDISGQVNGRPSVSMAIFQLPDANALDTADIVKSKIKELEKDFPKGLSYEIRYDTTPFIRESIGEVFKTLREAVLLVAFVVLLFLQNWRSALIPLVAVPVAIIGTFAVMLAFGYTLNNLTLFGLVLAIGIVVDDAIVVVEAVEHHIEHGVDPYSATIAAMQQVSGPVIAIGLVLSAVFVPCMFITGIIGQFFRQFALTIATSTIISAFNSLTLSPALAALLLRSHSADSKKEVLPRLAFAVLGAWLGSKVQSVSIEKLSFLDPAAREWVGFLLPILGGAVVGWLFARLGNALLAWAFGWFNRAFQATTRVYTRFVGGMLRVGVLVLLVYAGLLGLTYLGFTTTPTGFIPSQDMGYLLINVQLPDSAAAERTRALMSRLEMVAHETPGVKHTQAMSGQSLLLSANGSNFGSMFVILEEFTKRPNPVMDRFFSWADECVKTLDDRLELNYQALDPSKDDPRIWLWLKQHPGSWLKRWVGPQIPGGRIRKRLLDPPALEAKVRARFKIPKQPNRSGDAIAKILQKRFDAEFPEARITVLPPPPVRGVGRAGGFKVMVEDRGDNGLATLQGQTDALADEMRKQTALAGVTTVFRANVPQVYVDVNRTECISKEVALEDLFNTLRVYLGSLYVNDFNRFGRTWQVIVQADSNFRNTVDDVRKLKVRNARGQMVPLGAVAELQERNGPLVLTRYNMYPAAPVNGSAAPGVSSGEAIEVVSQIADEKLLASMSHEWTELAYMELQAGNTAMIVFGFAVVMVFLVLAAQYESWSLPLAVILVVPMCLLSAVIGVKVSFMDINIFTQIGFVVLVGLASKNAILIVEYAKGLREEGEPRRRAALDACQLRLRPIVMTSLAFILGVLPLILSEGAGAEMRRTLGVTVFSGMLGVTLFGIFLTPIFFTVIDYLGETRLFRSRFMQLTGKILLAVFTFGILWAVFQLQERSRRPRGAVPVGPRKPATEFVAEESDLLAETETRESR